MGKPKLINDLLGDCIVQFRQYFRIETLTQDFDQAFPLLIRQVLQQISDVSRVQRLHQLPRCVRLIGAERVNDFGNQGGMKVAGFAATFGTHRAMGAKVDITLYFHHQ